MNLNGPQALVLATAARDAGSGPVVPPSSSSGNPWARGGAAAVLVAGGVALAVAGVIVEAKEHAR